MNIKQPPFIAKLFPQRERKSTDKLQELLVSMGLPSYTAKIWDYNSNNIESFYKDIPTMKKDSIIGSALCFIMENAFKPNSDNHIMWVDSPFNNVKEALDEFHRDIDFDKLVLKIAYNLLLWGNLPIQHIFDKDSVMVGVRPIGNFFSVTPVVVNNHNFGFFDENNEYHYSYEYTYAQLDNYQDLGGPLGNGNQSVSSGTDEGLVNEFTYAPSYLSGALKPWRNINIIQDALLLTRLDKSQYYRIISVDVGPNPTAKPAIQLTNYYRNIFKKVRRISYDSNNMASSSMGSEFEVVLPTKGTNGIKIDDVGGQTEVTALADLDQMVNSLFAALRVSPSQIGYSENTPSSLGDSANKSWDSRSERLCSSLVYSVQSALRHIDYIYLLSKGFEVNEDDWSYHTVSITHIEDLERANALESNMESLSKFIQILRDTEVSYNKKYLIQSFAGSALSAYGLSMEELFDNIDSTEESKEVNASVKKKKDFSFQTERQTIETKCMIASGILPDSGNVSVSISSPDEITYEQYLQNPYVNLSKPIRFNPTVAIAIPTPFMDKGKSIKNCKVPAMDSVFYNSDIVITPSDIDESCIAPIHRIDLIGNKYYFKDKSDFATYLSMIESGFNDLYVDEYIVHKEYNYE